MANADVPGSRLGSPLREDRAGPKDSHVTLLEIRAEESEALLDGAWGPAWRWTSSGTSWGSTT